MTDTDLLFTVENQTAHIRRHFEHLFGVPDANFTVDFADDETILVTDADQADDYRWVHTIDSDDDGMYRFELDGDMPMTLSFPYPSEIVA